MRTIECTIRETDDSGRVQMHTRWCHRDAHGWTSADNLGRKDLRHPTECQARAAIVKWLRATADEIAKPMTSPGEPKSAAGLEDLL